MRMCVARRRRGATKVEYALMVMLVSVTCMLVIGGLGLRLAVMYDNANRPIGDAIGSGPGPVTAAPPDSTGGSDAYDPGGTDGKGKGKDKDKTNNGNHGNPGQGNAGNDKTGGNAGDNSSGKQ